MSDLGTVVSVAAVSAAGVPKHGIAFKVFASRKIPPLRLTHAGSLFQLNVANGAWQSIRSITKSGVYAAVLR